MVLKASQEYICPFCNVSVRFNEPHYCLGMKKEKPCLEKLIRRIDFVYIFHGAIVWFDTALEDDLVVFILQNPKALDALRKGVKKYAIT